jgi:hypothetical protein
MKRAFLVALVALALSSGAMASISVNEGGGGGGYAQLPACNSAYWGTTLYVQGHFWYCAKYSDHWAVK